MSITFARKLGERLDYYHPSLGVFSVTVVGIEGNRVKLQNSIPGELRVLRGELVDANGGAFEQRRDQGQGQSLEPASPSYVCTAPHYGTTLPMVAVTHVVLVTDSDRHKLQTMSPDDFPSMPAVSGHAWEIPTRGLKAALRVRYATDETSVTYAMGAVALQVSGGQRYAVATDGRKMAVQELGPAVGDDRVTLLPNNSARQLISMLGDVGTASLEDNGNQLAVAAEGLQFVTSLIEGRFPNWRKFIPETEATEITLPAEALAAVTGSAAIAATVESRAVTYKFADGMLAATAASRDGIGLTQGDHWGLIRSSIHLQRIVCPCETRSIDSEA